MTKTIKITDECHEALMGYGNKNETFDEVIVRLLKEVKK